MIHPFFARFVLSSKVGGERGGTTDSKTPILDVLDESGVNTLELISMIRKYGSMLEWMVACEAISKQRMSSWAVLSKEQAVHEVSCCLEDLFRKIVSEDNQRRSLSK